MSAMIAIILLTIVALVILGLEVFFMGKYDKQLRDLRFEISMLEDEKDALTFSNKTCQENYEKMQTAYKRLQTEVYQYSNIKEELHMEYCQEQDKLNAFKATLNDTYERESEAFSEKMEKAREEYRESYLKAVEDIIKGFNEDSKSKKEEIIKFQKQLEEYQALVAAAIEAKKRQEEMDTKEDFYKLQLSDKDISEIKCLKEVSKEISYPEAVNKVIYKVYYEKPYTALVGRVLGGKDICGIYKITNTVNGKCYVGQSVNVRERWRQHIKRGVGAENATRNKLYPAMQKYGVENFTFELVEEVKPQDLDKREDYWQEYFHAIDFGYSIK